MVSRNEDNAASLPAEPDFEKLAAQMDAEGDFDDSTPPEEAAPLPQPVEPVAEAPAEVADEPQTSEEVPEAEPAPSTPEAETPQEEAPKPATKLTDIPEFREYQSKKDREISELQAKFQQIEQEKAQAQQSQNVDAQVESYLQDEIAKGVAQTGYTTEEVSKLARSPDRVSQIREHFQQRALLQQYQNALHLTGKQSYAQKYAAQYNVSEEQMPALLATETPEAMEMVAKTIGSARERQNGVTQQRRAKVPPETAETAPVGASSNAPAKPGFWELIGAAEDKDYSDMNAEERSAVDMVMSGRIPE